MAATRAHGGLRAAGLAGILAVLVLAPMTGGGPANAASPAKAARTWSVKPAGSHLRISYGRGTNFPQYADLDKSSGFFRLVNSTTASWGTSVSLLPALWSKTSCPTDYCQGAPVRATWRTPGADLVLSIHGTIATLKVAVTVTLTPPARSVLVARVSAKVTGTVTLDRDRPGEAFKPVMLSSMHDSAAVWDARDAFTGTRTDRFPSSGWIIHPPASTADFGLQGGTTSRKKNAPTIELNLTRSRTVTGWLTPDTSPTDNNVGLWCAASKVLPSWSFTLTAEPGSQL